MSLLLVKNLHRKILLCSCENRYVCIKKRKHHNNNNNHQYNKHFLNQEILADEYNLLRWSAHTPTHRNKDHPPTCWYPLTDLSGILGQARAVLLAPCWGSCHASAATPWPPPSCSVHLSVLNPSVTLPHPLWIPPYLVTERADLTNSLCTHGQTDGQERQSKHRNGQFYASVCLCIWSAPSRYMHKKVP